MYEHTISLYMMGKLSSFFLFFEVDAESNHLSKEVKTDWIKVYLYDTFYNFITFDLIKCQDMFIWFLNVLLYKPTIPIRNIQFTPQHTIHV